MKTEPLLISSMVWLVSFLAPIESNRRIKRILGGVPLPSQETYATYFNAQIRRSWACSHDQTTHDLTPCQDDGNRCGAALIHPEFVITAAQCLMYYEVHLKYKGLHPDEWEYWRRPLESQWDETLEYAKAVWAVIAYIVLPKPKHTVYSDWSIFVGSADALAMTQKRHVVSVYPHSKFPILDKTDPTELKEFKEIQNSFHDVGLLRACEPFDLKPGEVQLANMLRSSELLQQQYDRIVKRGFVCLYIGFGQVIFKQLGHNSWSGTVFRITGERYDPRKTNYKLRHTWRSSICSSICNSDRLEAGTKEHTCILCSIHHGADIGVPNVMDYGGPVMCEGMFVSVITRADVETESNKSRTGSYPLHCVWNSISDNRLKYYMTLPLDGYHPLGNKRLRRFPMPRESLS